MLIYLGFQAKVVTLRIKISAPYQDQSCPNLTLYLHRWQ